MIQKPAVVKLMLVEDDEAVIRTLSALLTAKLPNFEIVDTASCIEDLMKSPVLDRVDLLILDIYLKGRATGLDVIELLRKMRPSIKILVMTGGLSGDSESEAFLRKANGFIYKNEIDRFVEAILTVVSGKLFYNDGVFEAASPIQNPALPANGVRLPEVLTPDERDYLRRKMEGQTDKEIAEALEIKSETISQKRYRIKEKLKLESDIESFLFKLISNSDANEL